MVTTDTSNSVQDKSDNYHESEKTVTRQGDGPIHFFRDHQKELAPWHPGLKGKTLEEEWAFLSETELTTAKRQLLWGVPLAYTVRSRFFYDAEFYINEQVLIPRMESEMILELLQKKRKCIHETLLDVGTGSGCLGLSCAIKFPELSKVILIDSSTLAIEVAALNRNKLSYRFPPNIRIEFQCSSCLEEIPKADIIVANPPYIKSSDMENIHPQVYHYEPHEALFIEDDNYIPWYQTFFRQVNLAIRKGGLFIMEGHHEQLPTLSSLFRESEKVKKLGLEKDLTGRVRFLWAEF